MQVSFASECGSSGTFVAPPRMLTFIFQQVQGFLSEFQMAVHEETCMKEEKRTMAIWSYAVTCDQNAKGVEQAEEIHNRLQNLHEEKPPARVHE